MPINSGQLSSWIARVFQHRCRVESDISIQANSQIVLYHQPEKMTKSSTEDLEARQANLEALKQQHGID
jgi:hypothetical protein